MSECSLGWFGKLPLSPEFIKHNASGKSLVDFDQWIQEGMYQFQHHPRFQTTWESDFHKAGPWHFLYFSESLNELLLGVAIPSRDKAKRTFPFLIFLKLDGIHVQGDPLGAVLFSMPFLHYAQQMAQHGWEGLDVPTFRTKLSTIPLPSFQEFPFSLHKDHYHHFLQTYFISTFWKHLTGIQNTSPYSPYFDHIVKSLGAFKGEPPQRLAWGFKFPILSNDPLAQPYDVVLWIDFIRRILQRRALPSLMMWTRNQDPERSFMLVSFPKPSPKTFSCLVRPDVEDDSWYDFTCKESATSAHPLNTNIIDTTDTPAIPGSTLTTFDWLNRIGPEVSTHEADTTGCKAGVN